VLRTVSELLQKFIEAEQAKLDAYHLEHGPTIGRMYEGLTANVLERTIPQPLQLDVVSGFITDDSGTMTGHMDCMLIEGEAEPVPFTTDHKVHVRNVIAVFEVKKTLYSKDLKDSFEHLREIPEWHERYIRGGAASGQVDCSAAYLAFSKITGRVAPLYHEAHRLGSADETLFRTLVVEQITPIRIVLGYHGFRSERSFRKAVYRYLEENVHRHGYGPYSFPQLMICGTYSLLKANGQPYSPGKRGDEWDFLVSSDYNPVVFMLELIWTRLDQKYKLPGLFGEDLEIEPFRPFLSGKVVCVDNKIGWALNHHNLPQGAFDSALTPEAWRPVSLNKAQFVVLNKLCRGEQVTISDPSLLEFLKRGQIEPQEFLESLLETGLVAVEGERLELITSKCRCAIHPTEGYLAAEDSTGRFSRWVLQHAPRDPLRKDGLQGTDAG